MFSSSRRPSRLSGLLVVGALLGSLVSFSAVAGQDDAEPDALIAVSAPVLASAEIAVVGDGLLAGSNVAPLRDADCRSSAAGPIETAANGVADTAIQVQNLACDGASLRDLTREQIPEISSAADRVFVGGTALEFDWIALEAACLAGETRSPSECIAASEFARATAANSFFSWRSALQQIARSAPGATIAVVSAPIPVTDSPLLLGSACCSDQVDAHGRVRAVFETAEASRQAVIESLPDLPIVFVDAAAAFAGHTSTDPDPWVVGSGATQGLTTGIPNAAGSAELASVVGPMMPAGPALPSAPAAANSETAIITTTSSGAMSLLTSANAAAPQWFAEVADLGATQTVWLDAVAATPAPAEDPPAEDPPAEDPPAEDPPAEDPPAEDPPAEDPPAEDPPAEDPPAEDPPAEDPPAEDPPAEDPGAQLQADPAPVGPAVATTADELGAAIAGLSPAADGETFDSAALVAAIDRYAALEHREDADQSVIIFADALTTDETSSAAFANAVAGLAASVTVVAPSVEAAVALGPLLAESTAAVVALTDGTTIASVLPVPTAPIDLQSIAASSTVGVLGRPVPLVASIDTGFATEAIVTWTADGGTVAVGQKTVIESGRLSAGDHELTVTATSDTQTVSATLVVSISVDGDGIVGETCTAFDPTNADTDADGIADACDPNDDGDSIPDTSDPCTTVTNTRLRDGDRDGIPDVCDGDSLDGPGADFDADGTPDVTDNCPSRSNSGQEDADSNGVGDLCEAPGAVQCTIVGTSRNDVLTGTAGDDVICGFGGDDELIGNGGDDLLIGGTGDDILRGHDGNDRLIGGAGNDALLGRLGDDVLVGGEGTDRLEGDEGDDILDGSAGADRLNGDDGNDLLFGGDGADELNGDNGNDTLVGGRGDDTLLGKNGNDTAHGGGGADRVRTGSGNDIIIDARTVDSTSAGGGTDLIGGASSVSIG